MRAGPAATGGPPPTAQGLRPGRCVPPRGLCGRWIRVVRSSFRCFAVEIDGDAQVDDIGNPDGEARRQRAALGELLEEAVEEDVRETETRADADVQPRPSAHLARGERDPDQRQDEGGQRVGEAGVPFDLDDVDRVGAFGPLLGEELVELRDVHGLDQLVHPPELGGLQVDERVEVAVLREGLHPQRVERPGNVAGGRPPFGLGVEFGFRRLERGGHRAAVVGFEGEESGLAGAVGVAAHVGEYPRLDLPVDVLVVLVAQAPAVRILRF